MITILFVRHGECDFVGNYIAGRKEGIHLNRKGRDQACRLARRLENVSVSAIFSGPLERVAETAGYIARVKNIPVTVAWELNEVDSGRWTSVPFDELRGDPQWNNYTVFRSSTRIPGGEMLPEVVCRVSSFIERIRREMDGSTVVMVSHGNPIKAAVAHYAGIPPDYIRRFRIEPASVSVLRIDNFGAEVDCVNYTGTLRI
ncbi:MAG: histidine phosphatase family protein [Chitinispirillaceae bacterium]